MGLTSDFSKALTLAGGLAASMLSVSTDAAFAAGPEIMTHDGYISADNVAVNNTISYAILRQSGPHEDAASYTVYHDGKSQLLGVVVHDDGHISVSGRDMNGYEEREMFEIVRDGLPRTQPDLTDINVPSVRYARAHQIAVGGSDSPAGLYNTGFNASEGWIGSCSIIDDHRILCLTNIYNDSVSKLTTKIDIHQVDAFGQSATVESAEYSRDFNSQNERDRYERFVDKGLQELQIHR